jgi:competence protein ComEC
MAWMLAFCAAVTSLLVTPIAPPLNTDPWWLLIALACVVTAGLLGLLICTKRHIKNTLVCATLFLCGLLWANLQTLTAMQHRVPEAADRYDYRISGEIIGNVNHQRINTVRGSKKTLQSRAKMLFKVETIEPLFDCASPKLKTACAVRPRFIQLAIYEQVAFNSGEQWTFNVRLRAYRQFGNPGSFDAVRHALSQGINGYAYVRNFSTSAVKHQQLRQPLHSALRINRIEQLQPVWQSLRHGDLLQALLLGERSALQAEVRKLFNATGTSHLMAISGLHIGVAAGFGFLLGRLLFFLLPTILLSVPRFYTSATCAFLAALFYACLAGFTVSTQRALIMISAALLAKSLYRNSSTAQIAVLTVFTLLLIDPLAVLATGFWLSFGAVFILIIATSSRTDSKQLERPSTRWLLPLLSSQKAMFVGMPLILTTVGLSASVLAPFANAIAIPMFSFAIIPVGLFALLISYLSIELAQLLLQIPDLLLHGLLYVLDAINSGLWSGSTTFMSKLTGASLILASVSVLLLLSRPRVPGYLLAIVLWIILFDPFSQKSSHQPRQLKYGEFTFTQLDVGQGTAVLLITENQAWLYDTGAATTSGFNMGDAVILPALKYYGIKKLDRLIISHGDNDHAGGMQAVLDGITVDHLLYGSGVKPSRNNATACMAGKHWQADGVEFRLMHPGDSAAKSNQNDASCVLQIRSLTAATDSSQLLITGDISRGVERELLDLYGDELSSNVLIAAHHGSNSSSSALFIHAVNPEYGVISNGFNNRYGHPHANVLQRFASQGIPVLRSDTLGAIQFVYQKGVMHGPYCFRYESGHFWQRYNNSAICKDKLQPRM